MFTFEIKGVNEFEDYLLEVKSRFSIMMEAMVDVAEVVKANTMPLTPIDTGRLGESFDYKILTDNSKEKVVMVYMSAIDQRDGYNYAMYQHETVDLNHPRGGQPWYLKAGINASKSMAYEIIETDYLSMFGGFVEV